MRLFQFQLRTLMWIVAFFGVFVCWFRFAAARVEIIGVVWPRLPGTVANASVFAALLLVSTRGRCRATCSLLAIGWQLACADTVFGISSVLFVTSGLPGEALRVQIYDQLIYGLSVPFLVTLPTLTLLTGMAKTRSIRSVRLELVCTMIGLVDTLLIVIFTAEVLGLVGAR